jgi:hypothetical protein
MPLSPLEYVVWLVTLTLHLLIMSAMIRRRLLREFPIFFAYTVFHVFRSCVLFATKHTLGYTEYFYTYWTAQAISTLLAFAVIYELFAHAFRPYPGIRNLGKLLFQAGLVVLLLVAVLIAASNPGTETHRAMTTVLLLERSADVVRVGLVILLFLVSSYLGLRLRDRAFGIALGFGVYAAVVLAAVALRTHVGQVAASTLSLVWTGAYTCALVIWMVYLLAPARKAVAVRVVPNTDLEKWNRAVGELLNQ